MSLDSRSAEAREAGPEPPHEQIERRLAEAGLELWQAPQGFWAIRLKEMAKAAVGGPQPRLIAARQEERTASGWTAAA